MKPSAISIADLRTIAEFMEPAYIGGPWSPLLLCLYVGEQHPSFVEAMPRNPTPPLGLRIDREFAARYLELLNQNPELHDGAILAGRNSPIEPIYKVTGWSYRLFPPPLQSPGLENRGSAFHSCRAMSALPRIEGVLLFSRTERLLFSSGELQEITNTIG